MDFLYLLSILFAVLNSYAERRKKSSSVAEECSVGLNADDLELSKTLRSNSWDFFPRDVRQTFRAPTVGQTKPINSYETQMRLISGQSSADEDDLVDPIDLQLRAAFIPRLGKRMNGPSFDQLTDSDDGYKRAASFTPRIGRAAFTPRIGKKAAFVPRIGRSTDKMAKDLPQDH